MKMSKLEKLIVNSNSHSARATQHALQLVRAANIPPGACYLDVGTGNGSVPLAVAQLLDIDAIGIDVDPEQIRLAQNASLGFENVRFFTASGLDLPYSDHEFDIVSAFKVTHHISNWPDLLVEMIRVLKPGGYLVFSDLVLPLWLTRVAKRVRPNGGYLTVQRLSDVFARHSLAPIHTKKKTFLYDAVLLKLDN